MANLMSQELGGATTPPATPPPAPDPIDPIVPQQPTV